MPKASLIFDKGNISGFAVLAEQSDLNPTTVVRELVQNSLDAAKEAGEKQAIIRFEIEKRHKSDIPDFDAYKRAFTKAKNTSHSQQDSAQNVIEAINRQIKSEDIETLFVTDNGIGLDAGGMNSLLSEGISNKPTEGAGSYGYGHTTVIPTSDLRYMLYGGLRSGKKIAAGHAVLASFKDGGEIKGKDGYFVVKKREDIEKPFIYAEGKAIPQIIREKLDTIEAEWRSGSVVIVPGFNHFNEADDDIASTLRDVAEGIQSKQHALWKNIQKAVACNFFAAMSEGKLRIEFKDGETIEKMDKDTISEVLDQYKDEKRNPTFLNGFKANRAYNTMVTGKDHEIETSLGKIKIKLNQSISDGRSSIDLCRNGMHITDSIPLLERYRFGGYALFHCLILADVADGEFHRLIRKAEPPKHNSIDRNRLDWKEKIKLNNCLKEIEAYLKNSLPELETEKFDINDVLNLTSYGIDTLDELQPRSRVGKRGTGTGGGGGGGGGGHASGDGFKRAGRAVSFRATPVQTGKRSYAVQVALEQSSHENEIRFALDESLDLTCDDTNVEDYVHLKKIKIDGVKPDKDDLIKDDEGNILGINLGSGDAKLVNLTFDFSLPDETGLNPDALVCLQAEMVSRQKASGE